MKQIKTLANSFVLQETDANGNVVFELGYPKGGLTYLIKNKSIKFYLTEDYLYKNVVWSANIPLVVDGVSYDANTLPIALKKIFEDKGEGGTGVTEEWVEAYVANNAASPEDVAAISAATVANAQAILNRYTKSETDNLLESYLSKLQANSMVANYASIEDDVLILNSENITL